MKSFLTGLLFLSLTTIYAQNTYHQITQLNTGQRWLRSSAAQASRPGTSVLIYQHGGATLSTSGGSTGQVTNLNGAGNYDLNRVVRTGGDTLFLAFPILNNYNQLHSQVVLFQGSASVSVTGNQTVSRAFDGSLGGITFIAADDQISFESGASLDVTGAGFRGGAGLISDSDCNRLTVASGLVYGPGNWRGSSRGEGISGFSPSQPFGRAAAANGGGGGNDHNAGGGGGGNSGGGGVGARNIVMGLFNNSCRGNFPGLGGLDLISEDEQLYFGGGGGAGHANNSTNSGGGNGGGLIVLWAPAIDFGNGAEIIANGMEGGSTGGDGGGGGGAAGTILMASESLLGSPDIILEGGNGGDVTNSPTRCFGPGGGGGGGRLLTTASNRNGYNPDVSLDGGIFGKRLSSNECGPNDEPAGDGEDGIEEDISSIVPFAGFIQSADTICGGEILQLTDASNGADRVEWTLLSENGNLNAVMIGQDFQVSTVAEASGTFRVAQTLFLDNEAYPGDTATFTVIPSPALRSISVVYEDETVSIVIIGATGFDAIRYDFGDGTVIDTNSTSLNHTYTEAGDYNVSVTLLNQNCGNEVFADTTFIVSEFASADTDLKFAEGCAPLTFMITDRSTGTYDDRRWNAPGGTPAVTNEASPSFTYTEPGEYTLSLTLIDAVGTDTIRRIPISVFAQPVANVSFSVDTASVQFTNQSANEEDFDFFWDFGDDSTSEEEEPTHTYAETGTYVVNYLVENGPCRDSLTLEVVIDVLSDLADLEELGIRLFPNPTSGLISLTGPASIAGAFDMAGRRVLTGSDRNMDLSVLPAGTYLVAIAVDNKTYWVRVIRR